MTHKLKMFSLLLCLSLLGSCTKEVPVLLEPPANLLQLPAPVVEPEWFEVGNILESRDLLKEDNSLLRAQLRAIIDWFKDMRATVKEN